jgi:hypothetical protein
MGTQSRVVGSGFTTLTFGAKTIAFMEGFDDSGQGTPAFGPQPVYSIGNRYADEIVTSRVMAPGTLTVTLREVWHEAAWRTILQTFGITATDAAGANDILDAYDLMDAAGVSAALSATMVIKNPNPGGGVRGKVYTGLTITAIDDGETVTVGGLNVARRITFMYLKTKSFTGAANSTVPVA